MEFPHPYPSPGGGTRYAKARGRTASAFERFDDTIDLDIGVGDGAAGVHNEIGTRALVGVGHLPRQHLLQLLQRHAGTLHDALALSFGRRTDNDDGVDALFAAPLQQQRDLDNGHGGTLRRLAAQKGALGLQHQGMDNGFEALEFAGLRQQRCGELLAIDLASGRGAGKSRLDCRHGGALVELVHLGVGIAHSNAKRTQTRGDGGLAHADGAGEANDQHQCASMSATSSARSSSVTSGRTPNHLSKPGTA